MLNWVLLLSKPTKESTEVVWEYPEGSRKVWEEEIAWMAIEWQNSKICQNYNKLITINPSCWKLTAASRRFNRPQKTPGKRLNLRLKEQVQIGERKVKSAENRKNYQLSSW
jgi:hypothetical protein